MPGTLNREIIVGLPGSGKTTFLNSAARREGSKVFNWRDCRQKSLQRTIATTVSEMKRRFDEGGRLFMDEPFFLSPPLLEPELFTKLGRNVFSMATHRIAYFCLLEPLELFLIEERVGRMVSPQELLWRLAKPSEEFYREDVERFARFLNGFSDVQITEGDKEEILASKLGRIRTTPLVRDGLVYLALGRSIPEYLDNLRSFFNDRTKDLPKAYRDIIEAQLDLSF